MNRARCDFRTELLRLSASLGLSIVGVVVALGCSSGRGSDGDGNERELVPDCAAYVARLNQCMNGVSPEVASQRTAATRQALGAAAKDAAARERLGAQCRAAQQQLSRACR